MNETREKRVDLTPYNANEQVISLNSFFEDEKLCAYRYSSDANYDSRMRPTRLLMVINSFSINGKNLYLDFHRPKDPKPDKFLFKLEDPPTAYFATSDDSLLIMTSLNKKQTEWEYHLFKK